MNLDAGESADVPITFNSKEAGVSTFNVRVVSSDNDVVQDVSLSVSEDESAFFDFKNIGSGDFTYSHLVTGLNYRRPDRQGLQLVGEVGAAGNHIRRSPVVRLLFLELSRQPRDDFHAGVLVSWVTV